MKRTKSTNKVVSFVRETEAATDLAAHLEHSIGKIEDIIKDSFRRPRLSTREAFQCGYNAGRLGELTGLGRKVWDCLKGAFEQNDRTAVLEVMGEFRSRFLHGREVRLHPQAVWEMKKVLFLAKVDPRHVDDPGDRDLEDIFLDWKGDDDLRDELDYERNRRH